MFLLFSLLLLLIHVLACFGFIGLRRVLVFPVLGLFHVLVLIRVQFFFMCL